MGLIGIDYTYDNLFSLRGGYKLNFTDSGREDEEKITAGIGFHLGMFRLDYAIGLTKNLSLPHHISLSMKM